MRGSREIGHAERWQQLEDMFAAGLTRAEIGVHLSLTKAQVDALVELNFRLGNVVKYILRAGKKGDRLECLKKARFYLNREIEKSGG